MRITVLVENTSIDERIVSEHGLSLYIETNGRKILFDMGQSGLFYENAQKLGISIADVDFAVLSHAHYDHGGGLETFFAVNKKAPVYLSRYAFSKCYSDKYIGLNEKILELNAKRLVFTDNWFRIEDGLELYSKNEEARRYPAPTHGLTVCENGVRRPDDFLHEQYLTVCENGKKVVFSGCSHKGILNIADWFDADFCFGGFHFSKTALDGEGLAFLTHAQNVLSEGKTVYYTCHCTGMAQYAHMKKTMDDRLNYASGGMQITI